MEIGGSRGQRNQDFRANRRGPTSADWRGRSLNLLVEGSIPSELNTSKVKSISELQRSFRRAAKRLNVPPSALWSEHPEPLSLKWDIGGVKESVPFGEAP